MAALAAKLASEYARVREMHAADDGSRDADKLGAAATNLEELRLKARRMASMISMTP
jgi:hypothetical protein